MDMVVESETQDLPVAGARLGISRNLSYELARRNEFPVPVIWLGRRLVVVRKSLDNLLSGEA